MCIVAKIASILEDVMEIKRDLYLDKLIARKHNGLIKVVTGIRRCGKSYLLNTLFYNHLKAYGVSDDHIVKFAFDSADDLLMIGENLIKLEKSKKRVDPEKFMAYIRSKVVDNQMYYLLLDEVQLLDCFEAVLNGYLRKENMDVYVTGSNAKFLSKDIITEFAGRGDEIRMYPLSFAEFMTAYSGNICCMVVSRWLSCAMEQMRKAQRCRAFSMKSTSVTLKKEIKSATLVNWRIYSISCHPPSAR